MKKSKITRRQVIIQFVLLGLLALSVCLFLSLYSYDPADPGWSQTAWHDPISNFGGYIGAYASDVLLQFMGFVAYSVPVIAILICLQLMIYFARRNRDPINYFGLSFRIIGLLAFVFSATGFFALNIRDPEQFHAGGNLGDIVANVILPVMNNFAASMTLLLIGLACITLLTGLSWLTLLEKLGAFVMILIAPIKWLMSRKNNQPQEREVPQNRAKQDKDNVVSQPTDKRQITIPVVQEDQNSDASPRMMISSNTETQESSSIEKVEKAEEQVESALEQKPPRIITTLDQNDEKPLIKSTVELLQTIEHPASDEHSASAGSASETGNASPKQNININDVLTRMESALQSMSERKTTLPETPITTTQSVEQKIVATGEEAFTKETAETSADETTVATQVVGDAADNKQPCEPELKIPVEREEYQIADAPSKPLFTLVHNEPELKLPDTVADTASDSIPKFVSEPQIKLSDDTENQELTLSRKNVDTVFEPRQFEPEQVVDDAVTQMQTNQQSAAQHNLNHYIDNDTETQNIDEDVNQAAGHDDEDSLIHPLLRRDDKPLPKPTTPLPSLDLLTAPPTTQIEVDHAALGAMSELIEQSLSDYRVKAKVVDYLPGPVITRFEIELAPGIKAARISTLDRDLARSLSMPSVRVVEVIPGKPYVGIELPNKNRQTVYFREVLDSPQFRDAQSPLTVVLGKDISGQSVVADLAKMPHLLVAGTTGSGKSVGVNAMILSILYKSQPEDVRFIMIDPKMLELSIYEGIPHLLTQVVTDMKDAANALNWCVNEMERRYRLMSALGVRNIAGYNEKIKQADEMGRPIPDPLWKPTDSMDLNMPTLEKLPYIVVMVDEFADLIMAVGKKVEELIARLAQKARAAGIHLVLATQRPSVDVITGLIKANIPTRIAFTVSSKIDSRTILDQMGAESLLGMGDMLYLAPNSSIPVRVHGAFVRDEEVHAVVQDWKARGTPKYIENVTVSTDDAENSGFDGMDEELDPLFDQVVAFVVETRRASISSVQRKFRIGYNRAARIVEQMENEGIISAPSHNGNREVLAAPSHNDY